MCNEVNTRIVTEIGCIHKRLIFLECEPGTYGTNCSEICPDGYYGRRCWQSCPTHCKGICNKINGSCSGILILPIYLYC